MTNRLAANAAPAIRDFIRAWTSPAAPPFVPEICLHTADEVFPLWKQTVEMWELDDAMMPFWAFAWSGGQGLARFVLDRPEIVDGLPVVDLGAGSGLLSMAALLAGAAEVRAVEQDPIAQEVIRLNAALNGLPPPHISSVLEPALARRAVILAGDTFYDADTRTRLGSAVAKAAEVAEAVLLGDAGRGYLPPWNLKTLAEYDVPVMGAVEDGVTRPVTVWRLEESPRASAPR
ncbi:MAG TPA: 50S ribosomal protein L11 methyltransferase [Chloroflexota bacterium]|nr:50S ribosomal protein L11 methyltransferase [Chloroflexota bacterium]